MRRYPREITLPSSGNVAQNVSSNTVDAGQSSVMVPSSDSSPHLPLSPPPQSPEKISIDAQSLPSTARGECIWA